MPDHFPERAKHWNQLAARDEARDQQKVEEQRREQVRRQNMQDFEKQSGQIYYRPIVITHFDDEEGSLHDNKLGYGDIGVANKELQSIKDPIPKNKAIQYAYPTNKPVIIYYDTGEVLPAKIGDWGRGNFKQNIPPENWVDVWDPVRTKNKVSNKGWIGFKATQKPPDAVEKPTWGNYGIIDQAPAVRKH